MWFILSLNTAAQLLSGGAVWTHREFISMQQSVVSEPVVAVAPVNPVDLPRTSIDSHVKYYPIN